ncbi:MAG: hypothetical protein Alpg2KO_26110 [Alphaproteobacteria bacterium]
MTTRGRELNKRGATGISYGLVVGFISIVALAAVTGTGESVDNLMSDVSTTMNEAITSPTPTPTPADYGTRIFITDSTSRGGDFGGISGADAMCASDAENPNDGRTYIAFMSTSSQNAKDRVTITYPVRVAGDPSQIVASTDLFSNEFTYPLSGWVRWSGSDSDGNTYSGRTCGDWTNNSADGSIGNGDSAAFNNGLPYTCGSYSGKWYCISITP